MLVTDLPASLVKDSGMLLIFHLTLFVTFCTIDNLDIQELSLETQLTAACGQYIAQAISGTVSAAHNQYSFIKRHTSHSSVVIIANIVESANV